MSLRLYVNFTGCRSSIVLDTNCGSWCMPTSEVKAKNTSLRLWPRMRWFQAGEIFTQQTFVNDVWRHGTLGKEGHLSCKPSGMDWTSCRPVTRHRDIYFQAQTEDSTVCFGLYVDCRLYVKYRPTSFVGHYNIHLVLVLHHDHSAHTIWTQQLDTLSCNKFVYLLYLLTMAYFFKVKYFKHYYLWNSES